MPVFLYGIGFFAFVAGLAMIGFGIPINEFSFGNTLIGAGTTAAVGGLVIIAVGVAVGQLRRIAGMLADPAQATLARLPLPLDDLEPAAVTRKGAGLGAGSGPAVAPALPPAPGRAPFPPRAKADSFAVEPEHEPRSGASKSESMDEQADVAPSLRNPDEPSLPLDDGITLSPRHPQAAPVPAATPPGSLDRTSDSFDWRVPPPAPGAPGASGGAQGAPPRPQPQPANFDAMPAARAQPANFDAMWPAEGKGAKAPIGAKPEPKSDALAREAVATRRAEPEKPRAVAILKSGVVDGMGYTLYVDGSIEAELPQGTLRFASINELRSHLEKNT